MKSEYFTATCKSNYVFVFLRKTFLVSKMIMLQHALNILRILTVILLYKYLNSCHSCSSLSSMISTMYIILFQTALS